MKNSIVFGCGFLFLLVALQSCKKDLQAGSPAPAQTTSTINVDVASGGTYVYTAGFTGTLIVNRQAAHSQLSRTGVAENGSIIYSYNPAPGYTGADEVELAYNPKPVSTENAGTCPGSLAADGSGSLIDIKINVTR